jgi:hypothetical protein
MTKIKIKNSTTASGVPISGSLLQGELAVNITDKKLFVGNASGNPLEIGGAFTALATGSVSGISISSSAPAVLGLQTNVLVSGSLSASGVLEGDQSAINVYAAEGTGGYSQWMKFKDYSGYYSKIMGADDGAMYFQNQANTWNFIPSGAAAQSVSLDTSAPTGYIFASPTSIYIGGSSAVTTFPGDVNITKTLTVDHIQGDLDGAVLKQCKNTDSITLRKGDPVFIAGTVGATDVIEVQLSRSDTVAKMPAVGLSLQDLAVNATGHIVIVGLLDDVDTSAFSVGSSVFVNSTGWITSVRPTGASILVQNIGRVGRVNSNTGQIIVLGPGRTNDVPNSILASGTLVLGTPDLITPLAGTGTVFNTNAIAINMGGAASQLLFGSASSTSTFKGSINATGSIFNNGPISTTGYVSAASGYRVTSSAINAQTATGYTLVAADNGRIITFDSAATHTLRIPTGLDIGFNATIIQLGTGQVTCTGLAGATVNCYASGNKILGQHGSASILCYASNVYNLAGTLGI